MNNVFGSHVGPGVDLAQTLGRRKLFSTDPLNLNFDATLKLNSGYRQFLTFMSQLSFKK